MGNSESDCDIITYMNSCTNTECPNWGKLVVDANVVRYLLGGTIDMVGRGYVDKSWSQKLPYVKADLKTNLEILKRCSCDNELYISDPVLSEELDVANLKDGAHPPDLSQSVYSTQDVTTLRQVVLGCICVPTSTTDSEIAEFRSLLKNHGSDLADRDASLILVASKLSQYGIPTIIISQDPDFAGPWQILAELGNFSLGGITYRTDKLMLRSYADFITRAHECCTYSSEKYSALLNAWLLSIILRHITSLNQESRTILVRQVTRAIRVKDVSIANKPK